MRPSPLTDAQRDQAAGWVLGLRQAADLADLSGDGVVSSADLRKAADAMSTSVDLASWAPSSPVPPAVLLSRHQVVGTLPSGPSTASQQCCCDGVWRSGQQHAAHLAAALASGPGPTAEPQRGDA